MWHGGRLPSNPRKIGHMAHGAADRYARSMKLFQARLRAPNFGDDLNPWMWPRLLPGVFDDDDSAIFFGVGSIISHHRDGPALKIVLGAAFVPEYGRPPDMTGDRWRFYFVRGPDTAAALGLDPTLAVGDAAILLRTLLPPGTADGPVCFMPHWESLDWGYWPETCARAGVTMIDPRWPVEQVLAAIAGARLMICEAMHGAIVADALRVPWTPVLPLEPRHRAKWRDWAGALDLSLRPHALWPSSPTEWVPHVTRRLPLLGLARDVMDSRPLTPVKAATIRLAAHRLRTLSRLPGRLSDERTLDRAVERMRAAVARFRDDWSAGRL
jgi:succinoglycan biosynthesis protein ExoV